MNNVLREALEYVFDHGMSVVPVEGKKPIEKWQQYRERYPTEKELKAWFTQTRYSIALVCGEISETTVLDADSLEAEEFIYEHTETERIVETGSGRIHAHYAYVKYPNRVNMFGIGLDVRNDGGLAVLPPSVHQNGVSYQWIEHGTKGTLDVDLLPKSERRNLVLNEVVAETIGEDAVIRMTLNYLDKMDPAIAGEFGHGKMFRAACVIHDRLGKRMSPEEAMPILETYNVRCQPPFTRRELLHKLEQAWNRK